MTTEEEYCEKLKIPSLDNLADGYGWNAIQSVDVIGLWEWIEKKLIEAKIEENKYRVILIDNLLKDHGEDMYKKEYLTYQANLLSIKVRILELKKELDSK